MQSVSGFFAFKEVQKYMVDKSCEYPIHEDVMPSKSSKFRC